MRVCVRGIRTLDFVSNGDPVQGTQIFYTHPSDGIIGEKADKIFIRKGFSLPPELAPGKYIDIFCDTKGHVEHIQVVSAPAQAAPAK